MPKVVVTMPAYRAAGTLAQTLADLPPGVADEIILVDDASPDRTASLAKELGIRVFVHPTNRGYGGNQKTCYTEALREGADIVVMLHPDYQYDPKAVPLLIAPILAGDADMTFGSRFAGLGDPVAGGMPLYRYWGNRITTTIENLMLGSRFTDMHSGMRAYTRRCLLSLPFLSYSDDFVFDSEFLVDVVTSGQRVVEVPIPTSYTKESSSISVSRSIRYILGTIAYCAKASLTRGRRGRRWAPAWKTPRRARRRGSGPERKQDCVLCGPSPHVLVHPATAEGPVPASEFSCTTEALGQHDDILQCRGCGLVSAAGTMEHDEVLDAYTEVVDEAYLLEEEGRRELFDWVVEQMEGYPVRGKRLVEVGANLGLFLDTASKRGWQATGIEPSRWAVETGRDRFGVDLRQGTVESLDLPDRSADVVVMLDVLEHLVDPVRALKALRPILDDEGLLILATVDLDSVHSRIRRERWPWFIRSHLFYFGPETLHATLHRAGFKVINSTVVPRWFKLSYIAHRGGEHLGAVGRAIRKASEIRDVRVPVGWLGDITLVAARIRKDP